MKKLSLKEQLIWLAMLKAPYRTRWHYVHECAEIDGELGDFEQSLEQCQFVLLKLVDKGILSLATLPEMRGMTEDDYERVRQLAQQAIAIGDAHYPEGWKEIPKPPLVVFYKGEIELLQRPLVSIVGTRSISPYGRAIAELLSRQLVQAGFVCVSGLAKGVDQVVHETAQCIQEQSTIAIIATGLNQCYPKQHAPLQQRLSRRHLVLSEYLPDEGVRKHHFIMRNRLVAGVSPVTIIVEAARQSGSLITANFAVQFNREVYALPGRITDSVASGCNDLIRAGAIPICSIDQVVAELRELFWRQSDK